MDKRSHAVLVMIASSISLAAFVAISKNPLGLESMNLRGAILAGVAWALMPWVVGALAAGLNAAYAKYRKRRNIQAMRYFIWLTCIVMVIVVVGTIADP